MSLMLHCGGEPATRKQVDAVKLPIATKSYQPVAHGKLVDLVTTVTQETMPVVLQKGQYGLRREGNQLFAHLQFQSKALPGLIAKRSKIDALINKGNKSTGIGGLDSQQKKLIARINRLRGEMGMSIGVVNSYDKLLRIRIAAGATVFVCDNLMLTGDITYMRKHTVNVWKDIENAIKQQIGIAEHSFLSIQDDAVKMKEIRISDNQAFGAMGVLFGENLFTAPMMTSAKKQWFEPTFPVFKKRNKWSLYNACTFAMKLARPDNIMENHINLHTAFTGGIGANILPN